MDPKPLSGCIVFPLIGVVVLAFLVMNAASDPRYHDPLFWTLVVTILFFAALAVVLHSEPDRGERIRLIRLFCFIEVLVFVIGAVAAIVREVHAGRRIW